MESSRTLRTNTHTQHPNSVSDLVCGIVVLLQIRVGQRLLHLDPLVRVKGQHLVQQVQSCSMRRRMQSEWVRKHFI